MGQAAILPMAFARQALAAPNTPDRMSPRVFSK
jgi:hypothetical protein